MVKKHSSHRIKRLLAVTLIALGIMAVAVAVLSNHLGLTHGSVSRSRILLGLMGVAFIAVGVLRRHVFGVYRSVAIIGLNTIVLVFGLEIAAIGINRCVTPELEVSPSGEFLEVSETEVERQLYVGWRAKSFAGDFINIDDHGHRFVPTALKRGTNRPVRVFAFGGSTIWGEGASDAETIPAFLQQQLSSETGARVEVKNFGQRGWVSTQSLFQLMLSLQNNDVPDVVIFYDGYNEIFAAATTGRTGVPENLDGVLNHLSPLQSIGAAAMKSELGQLIKSIRSPSSVWPSIDVDSLATGVVDTYLSNLRLTRALGREYGFDVCFFWQPQLFTDRKPLTEAEQTLLDHPWLGGQTKELTTVVYDRIADAASREANLIDIRDAFQDMHRQIYFDTCHVNADGNRRVAEVMLANGVRDLVLSRTAPEDESLTSVTSVDHSSSSDSSGRPSARP